MLDAIKQTLDDVFALLKAPLVGELDSIHLALMVGVVLIALLAWGAILSRISEAASEV